MNFGNTIAEILRNDVMGVGERKRNFGNDIATKKKKIELTKWED